MPDVFSSRAAVFGRPLTFLMMVIIALAPLPLGSNRPAFEGMLLLASSLCLLLWGWQTARTGESLLVPWRPLRWVFLCGGLALLWGVIQTLPMPDTLAHPLWQQADTLLGGEALASHISLDPAATLLGLLRFAAYAALFAVALQMGRSTTLASRLLGLLALSAGAYAAYGLGVYLSGNERILWFAKESYPDSLTSTFINRNAYAASAGMGLIIALGLLANFTARTLEETRSHNKLNALWLALEPRYALLLASAALLPLALLLSNSRMGLAATLAGAAVLGVGLFATRLLPRRLLAALALLLALAGGTVTLLAGDKLLARFDAAVFAKDERDDLWRTTAQMITDAPLTGHGLNTYDQLHNLYRDDAFWLHYTRAHNSYLELAAELGLPAAALWFTALLLIGSLLLHGVITRRQNRIYPLIGLAVLSQAALHSVVDFSFQIPANAAWLTIILGIGCAQSLKREETV